MIEFIPDNEGLDQLIPYRGVYKGKKVNMNFFFSAKNVTSRGIEELKIFLSPQREKSASPWGKVLEECWLLIGPEGESHKSCI